MPQTLAQASCLPVHSARSGRGHTEAPPAAGVTQQGDSPGCRLAPSPRDAPAPQGAAQGHFRGDAGWQGHFRGALAGRGTSGGRWLVSRWQAAITGTVWAEVLSALAASLRPPVPSDCSQVSPIDCVTSAHPRGAGTAHTYKGARRLGPNLRGAAPLDRECPAGRDQLTTSASRVPADAELSR